MNAYISIFKYFGMNPNNIRINLKTFNKEKSLLYIHQIDGNFEINEANLKKFD